MARAWRRNAPRFARVAHAESGGLKGWMQMFEEKGLFSVDSSLVRFALRCGLRTPGHLPALVVLFALSLVSTVDQRFAMATAPDLHTLLPYDSSLQPNCTV